MNTYGLWSINHSTFNQGKNGTTIREDTRNKLYTCLKLFNATFAILGYTERYRLYSGAVRMVAGATFLTATLVTGDRSSNEGFLNGRFWDEAVSTAVFQMGRGAIEGFVSSGRAVNLLLGMGFSWVNAFHQFSWQARSNPAPLPNPNYPLAVKPLHLA